MFPELQYISNGNSVDEHLQNIQSALEAGCIWIQLRLKKYSEDEIITAAEKTRKLCDLHEAIFILNDHAEIAMKTGADGIHLGLTDLAIPTARKIMGERKIIGGTANTFKDILKRVEEKADYVGLGPFRFTTTKEKLSAILGLEGYRNIMQQLSAKNISIPIFAIGGIELNDISKIRQTGIYGVAVSGLITNSSNKKNSIQLIHSKFKDHVKNC